MRHKFETLLACSESFNQGEICGKAGGMMRNGGELGFLLLEAALHQDSPRKFFLLFLQKKTVLLTFILKTCPKHKILLLLL